MMCWCFQESKRAYVIPTRVEPLYKCFFRNGKVRRRLNLSLTITLKEVFFAKLKRVQLTEVFVVRRDLIVTV
jgi:hypothetical protein